MRARLTAEVLWPVPRILSIRACTQSGGTSAVADPRVQSVNDCRRLHCRVVRMYPSFCVPSINAHRDLGENITPCQSLAFTCRVGSSVTRTAGSLHSSKRPPAHPQAAQGPVELYERLALGELKQSNRKGTTAHQTKIVWRDQAINCRFTECRNARRCSCSWVHGRA